MFSSYYHVLLCVISFTFCPITCTSDLLPPPPSLMLYSLGEPGYTDVLVKRVHDNLTLVCELKGEIASRNYVWNYIPRNTSMPSSQYFTELWESKSKLTKVDLQVSDSGQYMCSAPPFSVTKYILVQTRGPLQCARGAFWCGSRCVLPAYVCDGRTDCLRGEDEHVAMCAERVCSRSDKLNCSSGRCISEAACCRSASPLCQQPDCCNEYPRYSRLEGYVDVEFPPQFEDRHAPDDYGFIQSTIYTVTACALIFMIAVVLLVSAICKMHMKRAALRSYAHAERATSRHYSAHYAAYAQARYPPRYESSRLLHEEVADPPADAQDASSPARIPLQCNVECPPAPPAAPEPEPRPGGFGLARLTAIFSSRYRPVPTQPTDVEMTNVRSSSLNNSPTRGQLQNYRSPTYCDLNSEFFFANPETPDSGRDLNYHATPVDYFRRRAMRRNTLERVMDQIDRQRLTLQLGRFQFTLPSFSRDRRPDTPNVAEININDLDFVRLNSTDTYTLNGRTIRLLGADFENYPVMPDGSVRPPPYTEAMRYKLYGPPPEYLSREGLNREARVDEEARNNVEMPPCYDDLASGGSNIGMTGNDNNNTVTTNDNANNNVDTGVTLDNANNNNENTSLNITNLNSGIDDLPAIDCDANANETVTITGVHNVLDNALLRNNETVG
ncbi:hypothetical protein O3G_MSEX009299 [Manduca sexta]|uniref:Ig-like domain-containing protein n=1 Tax=Manduca sexta TaxID=7130 RepID=A0A922CRW6_MANSE|nr:hypothetical protein O3G_MSEX009299 [Manduca sexta]